MTFVKASKGKTSNNNDKVMTPFDIAKELTNLLPINPTDACLDPFMGTGAFYNNLPINKDWCEIDKGLDFFNYTKKVDWIVRNPPYSILDSVLDHSFTLANNVVYLIPLSKAFSSMGRIRKWIKYGNIKKVWILSACRCGFPFGFPAAFVWWEKDYKGSTEIIEYK